MSIFRPMRTRMTPPQRSAFRRRAKPHPKRMPNVSPIKDRANETKPIMPTGDRMVVTLFMPRKANDTPTARASMLVATASMSTTFRRVGSKSCQGNPVVYVFDEVAECASAGPSDEGHQCLKKAEEEGYYQHRTPKGTL